MDASAVLVKGLWSDQDWAALALFGVKVRQKVKYLGILIGHVTPDDAYAWRGPGEGSDPRRIYAPPPPTFTERVNLF